MWVLVLQAQELMLVQQALQPWPMSLACPPFSRHLYPPLFLTNWLLPPKFWFFPGTRTPYLCKSTGPESMLSFLLYLLSLSRWPPLGSRHEILPKCYQWPNTYLLLGPLLWCQTLTTCISPSWSSQQHLHSAFLTAPFSKPGPPTEFPHLSKRSDSDLESPSIGLLSCHMPSVNPVNCQLYQ